MRRRLLIGIALVALVGMSAVTVADAADAAKKRNAAAKKKRTRIAKKTRLKAFRSCAALARYGRRHVERGPGAGPPTPTGLPGPPARMFSGPGEGGGMPGTAPAPVAQEDQSSGTNVQEVGVDEPDAVKSRGSTIFAVAGEQLHAIDTSGATPKLLASLPIDGFGHELLLSGDRLLVFSRVFGSPEPLPNPEPRPAQIVESPIYAQGTTVLTEVDASDPAAMKVVRSEEVPGDFVSARLTGQSARVVISATPPAVYDESLRGGTAGWMPRRVLESGDGGNRTSRRLAPCSRVRRPVFFSGLNMLTVLTIDMTKGLPAVDSDAIESGGEIVYASPRSIYVATQRWTDEPTSSTEEPPRTSTAIHRFAAFKNGETAYRSSGRVPGFLLNQFSMSEQGEVLRVASTESPTWWGGSTEDEGQSYVTNLERGGGVLLPIGQVGGLGRGERIYAVRFIGDTGYVVTFRQVDPLYTIDLSKPREPRVAGELKILGYSAYLHPLESDLLLGVGQDASERGQVSGFQLSLFDVGNPANPKRLHQLALGEYSSSEAEYDHHAFLWWAPSKLAVLPIQSQSFTGAVGFGIDRAAGIGETGRASHRVSGDYDTPIRRALVVGGRLFTLSDAGLEQNSLVGLGEEAFLALPARG